MNVHNSNDYLPHNLLVSTKILSFHQVDVKKKDREELIITNKRDRNKWLIMRNLMSNGIRKIEKKDNRINYTSF